MRAPKTSPVKISYSFSNVRCDRSQLSKTLPSLSMRLRCDATSVTSGCVSSTAAIFVSLPGSSTSSCMSHWI